MTPRLVAISGPLQGRSFPLEVKGELTIGRHTSNHVALREEWVSRQHCVVRTAGDGFEILDRKSRHGTVVNGTPVQSCRLAEGDRIQIGRSVFVFLRRDGPDESAPVLLDEAPSADLPTVELRPEDALYLRPDRLEALPASARTARDLNALLRIGGVVNRIADPEALQRQLLDLVAEVIPSERSAILFAGARKDEIAATFGRDRDGGAKPVRVSRTIVQRVLAEGVAVLANDLRPGPGGSGGGGPVVLTESLIGAAVRAVLCVPLAVYGRLTGALYLDTSRPAERFDQGHLELLTAIAAMAAVALENARRVAWLEDETERLREDLGLAQDLIGSSRKMDNLRRLLVKVAARDTTVLLGGESGTGKELAARVIHAGSSRAGRSFVAVNCAAMPENLLESELFGHERGAFTGAVAQKKGKIEVAEGGTLFLDEIGELALPLQAKLLRVLQEREIERVGSTRPIQVDLRVIAASNRDLEAAIAQGSFRQDLYYRLNVVAITLPPLRDRREDIAPLAKHFAARFARKFGRTLTGIAPEALACLEAHDWPGNVRELENAIERAVALGATDVIAAEDLPDALIEGGAGSGGAAPTRFHEGVREAKQRLVRNALDQSGGNITEAARILGLHPNYLHRLLNQLDARPREK